MLCGKLLLDIHENGPLELDVSLVAEDDAATVAGEVDMVIKYRASVRAGLPALNIANTELEQRRGGVPASRVCCKRYVGDLVNEAAVAETNLAPPQAKLTVLTPFME